jgi:murein DD-endopeptidase
MKLPFAATPAKTPKQGVTLVLIIALSLTIAGGCSLDRAVLAPSINIAGIEQESSTRENGGLLVERYGFLAEEQGVTQKILATAYSQYGKPYKFGGTSPETGFDCAGFTQWAYGEHGIALPRTTKEQVNAGTKVDVEDLRPGDLMLFWRGRGHRSMHVGIYAGDGKFIHSPHTGERIKESDAFDRHHKARFIAARRVINDADAAALPDIAKTAIMKKAKTKHMAMVSKPKKSNSTATASASNRKYRIQAGDTIWVLARKFGVSAKNLLQANNLSARHTLRVGQQLSIP